MAHPSLPSRYIQDTVSWEQRDEDTLYIHQNLNCKSSNQAVSVQMCDFYERTLLTCMLPMWHVHTKSIIIGPAGRTIQQITAEAKTDIEGLFKCPVDLVLNVRAQKT